jgi:hypothetical protein
MSELFREYTHIVAEPMREWPHFDIQACLKKLSWSVEQCYQHITPRWIENDLFTPHAVVQLALYACDPFREIPPDVQRMRAVSRDGSHFFTKPPDRSYPRGVLPDGYYFRAEPVGHIIDDSLDKSKARKERKHLCPAVVPLVETLATAFIGYEDSCEYSYGWPTFQAERDMSIRFLKRSLQCWGEQKRRRITPEHPDLYHNRSAPTDIPKVISFLQSLTEHDYEGARWPTNNPSHPVSLARKWWLVQEMEKAFQEYGPIKWPKAKSHRAIAAILNQMKIVNAYGKEWNSDAIKGLLQRGPGPDVVWTTSLTHPNLHLWNMKLK